MSWKITLKNIIQKFFLKRLSQYTSVALLKAEGKKQLLKKQKKHKKTKRQLFGSMAHQWQEPDLSSKSRPVAWRFYGLDHDVEGTCVSFWAILVVHTILKVTYYGNFSISSIVPLFFFFSPPFLRLSKSGLLDHGWDCPKTILTRLLGLSKSGLQDHFWTVPNVVLIRELKCILPSRMTLYPWHVLPCLSEVLQYKV